MIKKIERKDLKLLKSYLQENWRNQRHNKYKVLPSRSIIAEALNWKPHKVFKGIMVLIKNKTVWIKTHNKDTTYFGIKDAIRETTNSTTKTTTKSRINHS